MAARTARGRSQKRLMILPSAPSFNSEKVGAFLSFVLLKQALTLTTEVVSSRTSSFGTGFLDGHFSSSSSKHAGPLSHIFALEGCVGETPRENTFAGFRSVSTQRHWSTGNIS